MKQQATLLASWRAASTQGDDVSDWIDAEQWWTPAVDALADALAGAPVDAESASEQLGRQRAAAGVFLDSARRDVMNATQAAGCSSHQTAALIDALTLGWVDRTLDDYFTGACVDPLTELTSMPYLLTRLAEIYAESRVSGVEPSSEYAFVVVLAGKRSDPIEAETQMIAAQVAMRSAFTGGETLARIGSHCGLVLARRGEPRFGQSLRILRDQLAVARVERRLPGVRVWIEALPAERHALPGLLREVSRSGP
jgi:hypothetical protein